MKVLFIVTSFQRDESDVINPWMIETIQQLKLRGVEVTVYTSAWRGLGDHEVGGILVRRFHYCPRALEILSHERTIPDQIKDNKLKTLLVVPYMLFGLLRLRKLLKKEHFDIIHVHWPFPLAIFGYFAARWARAPVVNEFYGVELRWVRNKMPVFMPFIRWILKTSDLVVAISSHTRSEIERIAHVRIEIVPYGSPVPPLTEQRTADKDPSRTRRVLFVGRLVERKGVEFLVRAMKELDLPFPVELNIVGAGPEEENLRSLVQQLGLADRVNLAGRVSNVELKEYYASCDCFVLPAIIDSRGDTEGLGVVLIEALSYRKPVVASALGGIVDIIHHEKTGLAVPEKDPKALAGAISRLLTDQNLSRRLAEDGYKFVQRYFDWNRITDKWLSLYQELIARKNKE
jgi:glycosyltransferase involved in cell wall biosynthesis